MAAMWSWCSSAMVEVEAEDLAMMVVVIINKLTEKNRKSFLIFGNFGEIWVSVFHVKGNYAIDWKGSQHICASFGTIQSIPRSPVWP